MYYVSEAEKKFTLIEVIVATNDHNGFEVLMGDNFTLAKPSYRHSLLSLPTSSAPNQGDTPPSMSSVPS